MPPSHKPIAEINVVPYIDVMLVLLIIFMITAPLLSQGVHVNLPQAPAKVITHGQQLPLIVSIDQQGAVYCNKGTDNPLTNQQLALTIAAEAAIAKEQQQSLTVFVKADKAISYDKVMQTMVILQQAGITHIGLITDSSDHESH